MARLSALRPPTFKLPFHWTIAVLVAMVVLIQYPLWLGKGGWLRVADLDAKLHAQQTLNAKLVARNQSLSGEVADLKNGLLAIEERARNELDLIKPDEIFVSVVGLNVQAASPAKGVTAPTSVLRAAQ
jgi:cell division protein FtsB